MINTVIASDASVEEIISSLKELELIRPGIMFDIGYQLIKINPVRPTVTIVKNEVDYIVIDGYTCSRRHFIFTLSKCFSRQYMNNFSSLAETTKTIDSGLSVHFEFVRQIPHDEKIQILCQLRENGILFREVFTNDGWYETRRETLSSMFVASAY